jgi:hypothetical protein
MPANSYAREAVELHNRSRGMAFAAPRSASVVRGLASALEDKASLSALLGEDWLDRPLAGVRLLAGVHDLVLSGKAPELEALMYRYDPDAAPADGDVLWKMTRQAMVDHPDEMRAALDWPVQQHLPGRAAFLLSGLVMLAQPRVRVLELGACAGLTLQLDKYWWQGPGWTWGDSDSRVRFRIDSPCPPPGLEIVERSGCDIAPVDPRDPVMTRRLHAFVAPELSKEHLDLDAALEIAAGEPQQVDGARAQEWLERRLLEQPAPGVHTVVWHCYLWHQLGQAERAAIRAAIRAAASRYPITRISCEPEEPGGPVTPVLETVP